MPSALGQQDFSTGQASTIGVNPIRSSILLPILSSVSLIIVGSQKMRLSI